MPVNFLCPNPNCTASYSVAEENLGKLGRCKKCGTSFALVPDTRAESPGSRAVLDSFPMPVDPDEEPLPDSIGRYKVLKRLGLGGMGTVYLALDPKLEREVALKVPHADHSRNATSRERFLREARAVAKFHHPNFCPIFDIDDAQAAPFLVMAYIQGRSLDKVIEPGVPWNPRKAAGVVRQLAVALAEAHRQGIVHRDLKPANVMVDTKGRLILMDFGLARRVDSGDPTFTAAGAILGTPAYMPPEQAEGDIKAIGPRSDIYSLGVILYELLSGRRPFEGAVTKVLAQILMTDPQPPSTHYKEIDPTLEKLCLKAMARKPEDRYVSMDDFAGALQSWIDSPTKPASNVIEPVPSSVKEETSSLSDAIKPQPIKTATPLDSALPAPTPKAPYGSSPRLLVRVAVIGTSLALLVLLLVHGNQGSRPEISNSIGMKLKLIPSGKFEMGAAPGDPQAGDDEKPRHSVQITKPFYLGVYEVTQAEYKEVMDTNPSGFSAGGSNKAAVAGTDTSRYPVERVSWLDAIKFCNALSEREGLKHCYRADGEPIQDGDGYRLPTEAEWEYACRASTTTAFAFGPKISPTEANIDVSIKNNKSADGPFLDRTERVGQYKPNAFGLFDMHGNVGEWCWDTYDKDYYARSPSEDPRGPVKNYYRVIRGGCWFKGPAECRSSYRSFLMGDKEKFIGFRVVRVKLD